VLIRAAVGRAAHIVLSPDEKVLEMVSGNSEAWEIVDRRNNVYLKPKMDNADTNLLLTTSKREYSLDLRVVGTDKSPTYRLIFKYPQDEAAKNAEIAEKNFVESSLKEIPSMYANNINLNYTMQQGLNSDSFKPISAFDDGTFTYIKFPRGKDMPNVFRVLDNGDEAIIN
ncbi:TrbG/VirB9 family P-type conjugative transfer protein, partial [Kingella kingae]|uniref:TrbG/VirB9 family P-type conjugative transfer protein n=1 Tax=Kingella kingae TaxID=504 RepID=UPI002549CC31